MSLLVTCQTAAGRQDFIWRARSVAPRWRRGFGWDGSHFSFPPKIGTGRKGKFDKLSFHIQIKGGLRGQKWNHIISTCPTSPAKNQWKIPALRERARENTASLIWIFTHFMEPQFSVMATSHLENPRCERGHVIHKRLSELTCSDAC